MLVVTSSSAKAWGDILSRITFSNGEEPLEIASGPTMVLDSNGGLQSRALVLSDVTKNGSDHYGMT